MENHWCFKCKEIVPLLSDDEYEQLVAVTKLTEKELRERRMDREIRIEAEQQAVELHFKLTGRRLTNPSAWYHHQRSTFGDVCPACGKLFRTPQAAFCAECGFKHGPNS